MSDRDQHPIHPTVAVPPASARAAAARRAAKTVQAAYGALSVSAASGSTAYAATVHDTTGLIVTAVAGVVTTALTVVVPQIFWWRAQNPLRQLRWWHRRERLVDVTGQQLVALQREAMRQSTGARAAVESHPAE